MNNEKNWLEILRLASEAVKDYGCEIVGDYKFLHY